MCGFLPRTIDRTEFDSVQTLILTKIPKNIRKTIIVNPQSLRCTGGRLQKASFSNGRDPVDCLGCERGKYYGSKKIAGRGNKFWTPLGLSNSIQKKPKSAVQVPANALWTNFFRTKTFRCYGVSRSRVFDIQKRPRGSRRNQNHEIKI